MAARAAAWVISSVTFSAAAANHNRAVVKVVALRIFSETSLAADPAGSARLHHNHNSERPHQAVALMICCAIFSVAVWVAAADASARHPIMTTPSAGGEIPWTT